MRVTAQQMIEKLRDELSAMTYRALAAEVALDQLSENDDTAPAGAEDEEAR